MSPTLDDSGPVQSGGRLGKPYLSIGVVIAFALAIVGLGYLGPRSAPDSTVPSATNSSVPSSIARGLSSPATVAASATPVPTGPDALQAITGLARLRLPPDRLTASTLPLRVIGRPIALVGLRLFYVVAGYRLESSVIGSSADPQTLAVASDGESISELAAAGDSLVYVVISVGGAGAQPGSSTNLHATWRVWLLDLRTGVRRQLAEGTRDTSDFFVAGSPVHVAVTGSAYAIDRPASPGAPEQSETVEVHALDGRLQWSSRVPSAVLYVMLGGSELAVVAQDPGSKRAPRTLWLSDSTHPNPVEVSRAVLSASMSADGAYLAWDLVPATALPQSPATEVGIENTASGAITLLGPPTTSAGTAPAYPTVSATADGPVVAWLATAPGGLVYPAFSTVGRGRGGFFDTVQQPVWLEVDGSRLTWVVNAGDGRFATAFATDLGTS